MLAIDRRGFAANLGAGRKAPCRAATTANITLSGEQTIDGVAVVADDRVLVKDQTNTIQNAVYVCKTGDWELASDFNQRGDAVRGSLIFVTDGDSNAESEWYVATTGRPWPGRQAITFTQLFSDRTNAAVNVGARTFTLTPDDSSSTAKTANTAAIQEAIDYAHANELQVIRVSAGVFWCDPGIYLDAPGNLRSSLTPTIFNFSMHLSGAGGLYNHEGYGTQFRFSDNSAPAIIVGTGQGMRVSDFSVIGPTPTSRAALSANGIGIALAGGSGGLSRALVENVGVINFRKGYRTGYNADGLCDSVTLVKCVAFNCYDGIHWSKSQNYINNMIACDFGGCVNHVLADNGKQINIWGGNYSTSSALAKAFAVSGTTGFTTFSDSFLGTTFTNLRFTTTLSSPNAAMAAGDYTTFALLTEHFGAVGLELESYNSGTGAAQLKLARQYGGANGIGTLTEADVQACTTLYAAERITTFSGIGINANGVHVENNGSCTTLIDCVSSVNSHEYSSIRDLVTNYTVNQSDSWTDEVSPDDDAIFVCQTVTPWISVKAGHLLIDGIGEGVNGLAGTTEGPLIFVDVASGPPGRLQVRRHDIKNPNIIVWGGTEVQTRYAGAGEWDVTPFIPPVSSPTNTWDHRYVIATPFLGWRPARHATPRLASHILAAIEVGPGNLGTYPPLFGNIPYSVISGDASYGEYLLGSDAGSPTATLFVRSAHDHFSYGKNLTVNWEYQGESQVLYVDDFTYLFPGLRITLDNGGGDVNYIITGLYPTLGYATVIRHQTGTGLELLAGTAATEYTGATIKQTTYSFSRVGTLPASKFTTNSTVGAATAASGDLTGADFVNIKLTAVGSTNYTTRTAALMFSDIPGCYSGYKYMLAVSNVSTGNTVLAGGSNVTVNSTGNIPASSVRMFEVRFTSTAAVTIDGQLST